MMARDPLEPTVLRDFLVAGLIALFLTWMILILATI